MIELPNSTDESTMLVSIIINNYNYRQFLGKAIQSALDQTYRDIEVIVVDDGSTDNSESVVKSFGRSIKPIFKENGGQGSAFNSGFEISRGELILFLDSDDALDANAIETAVAAWRPEFSKLHFPLNMIDSEGNSLNKRFPADALDSGSVLQKLLTTGTYTAPPTTGNLFSRTLLNRIMPVPETDWKGCADTYLVFAAPFFGTVGTVNQTLGSYRMHGTSMTAYVKEGRLIPGCLASRLRFDVKKQELINAFSRRCGQNSAPDSLLAGYLHYKERLASLKMFPELHPFKSDKLTSVSLRFMRAVWGCETLTTRKRILLWCWAIALVALPKAISEGVAITGVSPYSRTRLWQSLEQATSNKCSAFNRVRVAVARDRQ